MVIFTDTLENVHLEVWKWECVYHFPIALLAYYWTWLEFKMVGPSRNSSKKEWFSFISLSSLVDKLVSHWGNYINLGVIVCGCLILFTVILVFYTISGMRANGGV